ncbi:hypothetical protein SELR_08270 [Selenomonas ruminantium subsp. lactilytica TAM6421]|uniref:DUF4280 domain-containing protein n=1 Tax=Selenomonas ruminantium subsp. lactilytica (strain NBRC 103574 / TAM6421) TaxID=927704 RepID=I0GP48_SELRL|nr:PAAR-like protein [Selenomonas ruminantium]BAL82535.1 hypothetical protein SELR_08270 [Selenomonas ruminantium subsp. lactilytica TAM6421]
MSDVKEYMTDKKKTHCSRGSWSDMVKTKGHGENNENEQYLNATDHWPIKNIFCYGYCRCTGMMCFPDTPKVWIDVDENALLDGAPRLTEKSRLLCKHGGEISFGEGEAYGLLEYIQDLIAGKYANSVAQNDLTSQLKKFYDNKLVSAYLDITGGYADVRVAVAGAGLLFASNTSTCGRMLGGAGVGALGIYGVGNIVNGAGEFLEGVGAGEHDWDFVKNGFKKISPEYGETIYDYGNLIKSGREAVKSKQVMDIISSGKDLNDVMDVTKRKMDEYANTIETTKVNIVEYVDDSAQQIKDNVDKWNNGTNDECTESVKVDKNLSVLFEIYGN